MHHSPMRAIVAKRVALTSLLITLAALAPDLVLAQASPFMTGATAIQTKTFGRSGGSSAVSAAMALSTGLTLRVGWSNATMRPA